MELDSIQMTLIAIFLASAVAMVVVCDFLRKTFFRVAVQHPSQSRRRHTRPGFEGQAMPCSAGPSEFAKRSAMPLSAEVIVAEREPEPIETLTLLEPPPAAESSPLAERAVDALLWEGLGPAPAPRGMLSQADWQQAVAAGSPFTGVAVSIGIHDLDGSMWHSPALMRSVSQDIAGLLGAHDFGCRTAYDEFLIACPQEQDQPYLLKQITMRLWECQLRGQRAGSIRITWGGVDVRNQPLAEALACATERMRQTQRTSESIVAASGVAATGVAALGSAAGATVSCRPRRKAV